MAKNGFESMIYKLRDWLREEDNAQYVELEKAEALIEYLSSQEDWLYEDGSSQNYTVYQNLEKNFTS